MFQEPDSTILLASGMGKNWSDARGIFHNEKKKFLVWANEEDHLRIISMQIGADIKEVFTRFASGADAVQKVVKAQGYDYMHSNHLGYILVCLSNLRTDLRGSVMVKVQLLLARKDFEDIMKGFKLQARGAGGVDSVYTGGIWDISNADRLGTSEVDLVNIMIEGCANIVKAEQGLEKGEMFCAYMPGLGDEDYLGFTPLDCPAELPDLSEHANIMTDVLRAKPSIC